MTSRAAGRVDCEERTAGVGVVHPPSTTKVPRQVRVEARVAKAVEAVGEIFMASRIGDRRTFFAVVGEPIRKR